MAGIVRLPLAICKFYAALRRPVSDRISLGNLYLVYLKDFTPSLSRQPMCWNAYRLYDATLYAMSWRGLLRVKSMIKLKRFFENLSKSGILRDRKSTRLNSSHL